MMLVRAKIGPSSVHGLGLFATQRIPAGTKVWEFTPGFDVVLDEESVSHLSEAAREQFLHYAYLSKESGKWVLCSDDARFINHSEDSNTTCIVPGGTSRTRLSASLFKIFIPEKKSQITISSSTQIHATYCNYANFYSKLLF